MGKEKERKRKVEDEKRRDPDKVKLKKKTKRISPSSSPELPGTLSFSLSPRFLSFSLF